MTSEPGKSSFGDRLRYYRGRTADKATGKPLSQARLAYLISEKGGPNLTRNTVNNWENDKTRPLPQKYHPLLTTLIAVLYKYRGIETLDEADELLAAGDFRILGDKEIQTINPGWIRATPQKGAGASVDDMSPPPPAGPISFGKIRPMTVNLEAGAPLPVMLLGQGSGSGIAPPLPSLMVGREQDLSALKERLALPYKGPQGASVQVLTAIRGWPGVGKTTIAAALAHDQGILNKYPDGVLWISLGPNPSLLSNLATWGRALGSEELIRARTVEEASAQLASLLRNKRMLLMVDDVWVPEHAIPFNIGGRDCAMLITTRQNDVAQALAPTPDNIYILPVLTDEKALELLTLLAPKVVAQHTQAIKELVHELEGLPLALQVAGRLLQTEASVGFGVSELIGELRTGARLLASKAPADRADLVSETTPTIAALLYKSLERLDDYTRDCYAYLGAFVPKPATFDLPAMSFVWEVEDPKPIVRTLVNRGLIEYVEELDRYQMHSLLVMLAKSLLKKE